MTRALTRATGAVALAALVIALVASPAHAAAYRYWTYWQAAPTAAAWTFSTQGAGTAVPADGAVEGWAFGVTTDSASPEDAPSTLPDFAAICADTPAWADGKRVALVIDPGSPALAPDGEVPPPPVTACVVADPDATGYEILRSVADVRTDNGLVCGVAGYPSAECAPVLDDAQAAELLAEASASPAAAPISGTDSDVPDDDGGGGTPVATIAVVLLLIVGVATAVAISRRRREVPDA